MAKRIKSEKYPGIFWREVDSVTRPGKRERCFYAVFKRHGRTVEAKVGLQFRDDMTEAKAAQQRALMIEGRVKTPAEMRAVEKGLKDQEDSRVTMKKLWDHFESKKKSLKSISDDETRWRLYVEPALGDMDPANIARENVEAILSSMEKDGKSEATQRQVFALIKRIVNRGVYDDLCQPLHFKIKLKKLNNARARYFSLNESEKLMDALKKNERGRQTYYISLLSLNTGARFGEVASLKWADIKMEQKSIYIGDSKNGYARTVYMNDSVYELFLSLDRGQPQELVFSAKTGGVMDQISNLFYKTVKDLKLNSGIEDARQKICFHSLRHTFASWAVIEGCDIYRLKEVLGHKSIEMTMRYAHLAPDAGRGVVDMVNGYQNGKVVVSLDKARAEKQSAANE